MFLLEGDTVRCSSQDCSIAVDYGACRLMTWTRPVSIFHPSLFLLPMSLAAAVPRCTPVSCNLHRGCDADEWRGVQLSMGLCDLTPHHHPAAAAADNNDDT